MVVLVMLFTKINPMKKYIIPAFQERNFNREYRYEITIYTIKYLIQ